MHVKLSSTYIFEIRVVTHMVHLRLYSLFKKKNIIAHKALPYVLPADSRFKSNRILVT